MLLQTKSKGTHNMNTMEEIAEIVFDVFVEKASDEQMQQLATVLNKVRTNYARSFMQRVKNNVLFAALVEAADYTGAIQFDCSAHNPTLHRHHKD